MNNIAIGQTVTCAETGKQFIVANDRFTLNYALDNTGAIVSDEGVNIRERRALLDRSKPFVCYISSDGKHVTGWKCNVLGTIEDYTICRLTRTSFAHGSHIRAIRVRDVHGRLWYGRGSPGIVVTLRPCKK